MDKKQLSDLFTHFNQLKVLIIGDVMLDTYLFGQVSRISPEAPVPIIDIKKKSTCLGGAANVALNTQSLGAKTWIVSVVGNDDEGKILTKAFKAKGINTIALLNSESRKTTVKTRIIGNNAQMLRIDEEQKDFLNKKEQAALLSAISSLIQKEKPRLIIFEDYDKGVLSPELIEDIVKKAQKNNILTAVDPKKNNFWAYKDVNLFKPNLKELKAALNYDIDPEKKSLIKKALEDVEKKLKNQYTLLTLSEHGMVVNAEKETIFLPAHKRDITDVSGAGDSVIAVAACCMAANTGARLMAELSNLAGGLVCEKNGVVPIDKNLLLKEALTVL